MKIYISGYYGQNNLGDDYIFYSILDQLGNLKESVNLNGEIGSNIFAIKVYENLAKNYENITYVSCAQDSLVRDLELLKPTHRVEKMALFNQFAHTRHIETIAVLKKL